MRVQATRARIREREAAFARLARARGWVIGGAGALSLAFAGVAYALAPGHKLHTVTAPATSSSGSSAAGSSAPSSAGPVGVYAPGVQPPSSAPSTPAPAPAPAPQVVVGGS